MRESSLWSALGDPTRRALLDLLLVEPAPVRVLARAFQITQPAVSKHLRESGARMSTRGGVMNQTCVGFVLGALAATVIGGAAISAAPKDIKIQTGDVKRFYQVYEAAGGHPSAEQLQRDYLEPGTPGLHHLAKARNVTAERIAHAIETNPELYTDARTCMAALPRVRERLNAAFRKLLILYPEAQKPPVTIVVGRGRPLAISGPGDGVQIGLEAMCAPGLTAGEKNCPVRRILNVVRLYVHNQRGNTMSEFTYLFRGRQIPASPEHRQKHLEKWVAWFKDLGAKGHLKNPGHPLEDTGKVVNGNQKTVKDGPFAEAKDIVAGFIVVEATDLAHAVELSKGCPILEVGGSVEVRPVQIVNM